MTRANAAGATMPLVAADEFIDRVRARCAPHRNGVGGYCLSCLLAELEDVLLEENRSMKRDDAFELVQEWRMAADERAH